MHHYFRARKRMKMKAIENRAFRSPYRKIPWKGFFEVPTKLIETGEVKAQ